ncbi:MAG: response regulator [Lysobacterales bacterium]|jgi:DNA-binding response OmpR family regulator
MSSALPASHASPAASAAQARAREWVERFGRVLMGQWQPGEVVGLHEQLDDLVHEADLASAGDVVEHAIALSAYLCSFVEEGRHPDANQRLRLRRLCEDLAPEVHLDLLPAVAASSAQPPRTLLLVSQDAALAESLSRRLRDTGIAVQARRDVEAAIAQPIAAGLDAVLIDATELPEYARRARAFSHAYRSEDRRLALLVLTRSADPAERMFALRAGADEVIRHADGVEALATRVLEAVQPGQARPFRVLIVDDDRSQILFCEAVLRSQNVQTRACMDPEQAVDAVREFQPEVVLLDLYMPGIDGIEIASRIRALPGSELLSIVFLSGDHEQDVRFDVLAAGGDDFFTKPIQPRHLVTGVISRARRARALARRIAES